MKKVEYLKPVERIPNRGMMSVVCCNCGCRHVYHFQVDRGRTEDEDLIIISHFRDFNYEKLRRVNGQK